MELPSFCEENGMRFTWLCPLGPNVEDFQHVQGLRASHNCGTKCHVPSLEEGVETAETPGDGFRAGWLVAA